jgi:tRNA threonylcarbamoyladenosine biosynthesis protein TsaB
MKVLALDGALAGLSAALWDGDAMHAQGASGDDALAAGLAGVAALLARAGTPLDALDRIAVGVRPGSFTGLRIAISYAKAIAIARRLPLVSISSYDLLTPGDAPLPVLAVVRGRRGIVSARLQDERGARTASGTPADVVAALLDAENLRELAVAGNTEDVDSAIAERGIVVRALPRRAEIPAVAVASLALTAQPSASPHAVAPEYGELPAVTVREGA